LGEKREEKKETTPKRSGSHEQEKQRERERERLKSS